MFGLSERKATGPENKLFLLTLHIGRGANSEMPRKLAGAYVAVVVVATDHEAAAREAVSQVTKRCYEFIDIKDRRIHQLDPLKWESYVRKAWPGCVSRFPSQKEVVAGLPPGKVFFGPFEGCDEDTHP